MKTLQMMLKDGLIHDKNDKRPLPIGKNKKVMCFFKDELGGKIMKEFCELRAKTYTYLKDDNSEKKRNKKMRIKHRRMFKNQKDCLFYNKSILKSQQRFKSDHHKVHTEQINKIVLSSNDNKGLQTFDKLQHIHTEQMG